MLAQRPVRLTTHARACVYVTNGCGLTGEMGGKKNATSSLAGWPALASASNKKSECPSTHTWVTPGGW